LAEDGEAIPIGQIDIEQNEAEVGMLLDHGQRLTAVRSFEYDGFALQLLQDGVQRLAKQCVIVDNKNFHQKALRHPHRAEIQPRKYTLTCAPLARAVGSRGWNHLTAGD